MEPFNVSIMDGAPVDGTLMETGNLGIRNDGDDPGEVEWLRHHVDEMIGKVDDLEHRVREVAQFYLSSNKKLPNSSRSSSIVKDKDKEKLNPSIKKQQQDATQRETAAAKRMQELMRQFSTILRQAINHALPLCSSNHESSVSICVHFFILQILICNT
ncbi:transcription factor GTE6-like [Macadamia integrifolia]|uniref:transcription factor GTE6-like n=1 Tax=Macadamia integrifolia TaxID=60698 RepID=UPI001C4EC93E|nr:transcription factor GTE6-like [Macadamia integrifolia]XP_042485193.1 transcription factor GTE6-like [Macadamia integrifolia]XP_042485194.1 transcription factor GTE6-like [Macadamia integrifolia]XP_042485195.1 transcription factor GTE6-like [Macadamia integrifolia]XP_042485196.1 transcription factor GTE6-like [Macadamia integrifolia]